jgi:hypothetical protein
MGRGLLLWLIGIPIPIILIISPGRQYHCLAGSWRPPSSL